VELEIILSDTAKSTKMRIGTRLNKSTDYDKSCLNKSKLKISLTKMMTQQSLWTQKIYLII